MNKSSLTSLPSADDFYSILQATLPVSALPADRKTTLAQWSPLQAQLIVVKKLGVLKNTEETMLFNIFHNLNNEFKNIFFQALYTFSIALR